MFQATRRRLALWYTTVTAILLLIFASGFYVYVRSTLIERIDDTLNHVVEVVQRSLVIEPMAPNADTVGFDPPLRINFEASFRDNADTVEDDHIDLEWFSPTGELLWSTLATPLDTPLHTDSPEETVHQTDDQLLRQVTQRVQVGRQVLGYLRVSHPWFEVTKPTRQLIRDLSVGTGLMVGAIAAIGWFLSGLAMAPVRDSYQRLKQFTADASHELRNPIAVIQTNVQVALADPEPEFQQQQLQVVERLTRRLGRLVDDLLFLARQDSGIAPRRADAVALDELLLEVLEEQQVIATEKNIRLSLASQQAGEEPESLYSMQGDRDQLIRLFTNLVSNAVQYTPTAGTVDIALQRNKHQGMHMIQVQVNDTGIGIPEEAVPHLFDRFYRVDPSRTHAGLKTNDKASYSTGSGLGLAIAKVIVDNHQGHIQVDSIIHQGTTFTVLLPYSPQ
ncbi:HAMP domain-containing histidine kinase [Oculatella sp. LEGE 06141]|uniref:sensor histidine kinase n=1 Tax=Oculatella sp. LEGE 06141 TaxID=1828648 RepID=UPI0018806CCB|nr:HAMP domain-containing sensor histidine kinase [Oculatella sp. LEGE 06141]MBE9179444.1 HAMP domain-containing histidine kinase [Oculatella sp. LEGE 06141]